MYRLQTSDFDEPETLEAQLFWFCLHCDCELRVQWVQDIYVYKYIHYIWSSVPTLPGPWSWVSHSTVPLPPVVWWGCGTVRLPPLCLWCGGGVVPLGGLERWTTYIYIYTHTHTHTLYLYIYIYIHMCIYVCIYIYVVNSK